ncbi:MAG: HAMP domain-containing histidine kinase [Butyrivibrio sp.]|nr:HAMP domain-containing histidine kinase [Butyrivibrio sp.]
MLKNKDFHNLIILGVVGTLIFSACGFIFGGAISAVLIFALGAGLTAFFAHITKKRYEAIERLNDYLAQVLAGAKLPETDEQEEGEVSILKTNIYKVTSVLSHQRDLLSEEKIRLANALADISHQLKTLLTSMMVMNDLLKNEDDVAKRGEFLKTQSNQLDRMNWLILTLLKISKLDAGTVELKKEEVSSKDLIASALKPFEIQMELKEIKTEVIANDMTIRCDRNWTLEALQNIIKNCFEHMDAGGQLKIETDDTNLFSMIQISDTGCGIAKEDIPHIFERFYKGKNAGKDSVGIGLALSKSIIDGQHGEISVRSEEGVGTTFTVRFYKTIV